VFRNCIANSIQSNRVYREIRNYQLDRARSLVGTWRRVDDAQLISNRRAPVWRFVGSGSSSANRLCRLQVQLGNGAAAAPVQSWAAAPVRAAAALVLGGDQSDAGIPETGGIDQGNKGGEASDRN
jgi:hypothetical protein